MARNKTIAGELTHGIYLQIQFTSLLNLFLIFPNFLQTHFLGKTSKMG